MAHQSLLIRNGRVIDPDNTIDRTADVLIAGGKIVAIGTDLPESTGALTVDATGLLVTPGLIDIHAHLYHTREPEGLSVVADHQCLPSGVTTAVDTGTAGARHFLHFKSTAIDLMKTRILAFVNIVKSGMMGSFEQDPEEMDPEQAAGTVLAYPEVCVGIKTAHYWTKEPFDQTHTPWVSVDRALEAGELCDKPVMVDFFPRPERPYEELLRKMRPGDIHTHVFAQQFPVLDHQHKPMPYFREHAERGVIFDLGHGAASFWFRNAIPSFRNGFFPHSISTDLHTRNVNGPVFSMLHTMSKMIAIGMSLEEVIKKSTAAPAREIGRPELGNLSVGSEADVAILRVESGAFGYHDCSGLTVTGSKRLTCAMTIRAGEVVFDEDGRGMHDWQTSEEAR